MKNYYLKEIKKYPKISIKKQSRLIKRLRRGDTKVRDELIYGNLKRVVNIASKYQKMGVTEELISAGNYGLIKAIDNCGINHIKISNISNYFYNSIQKEIEKEIKNQNWIAPYLIGGKIYGLFIKLNKKLCREPSLAEIKEEFLKYIEKNERKRLRKKLKREPIEDEIELPFKFDDPANDLLFEAYLPSVQFEQAAREICVPSLEGIVTKKEQEKRLYDALSKLELREQEVLKRSFGLGDYEIHSLREIGCIMNVKGERIRQIKENAIRKLKIVLSRRI